MKFSPNITVYFYINMKWEKLSIHGSSWQE